MALPVRNIMSDVSRASNRTSANIMSDMSRASNRTSATSRIRNVVTRKKLLQIRNDTHVRLQLR